MVVARLTIRPTMQSYLLFGDEDYLGMFAASYTAATRRMRLVGEFARSARVVPPRACP